MLKAAGPCSLQQAFGTGRMPGRGGDCRYDSMPARVTGSFSKLTSVGIMLEDTFQEVYSQ